MRSGPLPFASSPWHPAQLDKYCVLPKSKSSARVEAMNDDIATTSNNLDAPRCQASVRIGCMALILPLDVSVVLALLD
jgi:hypothetical protein